MSILSTATSFAPMNSHRSTNYVTKSAPYSRKQIRREKGKPKCKDHERYKKKGD